MALLPKFSVYDGPIKVVGKPVTLSMTLGMHALGKRLRSNALKSSYSNALLISITRSERKLKIATASPSCRPNASQILRRN